MANEPAIARHWNRRFKESSNCNQAHRNTEKFLIRSNPMPKRVIAPYRTNPKQGSPQWVGLLGTAALSGRYESSKAKYGWDTDSEKVLWRKDEKDFEKRVKRSEIVEEEAVETDDRLDGCRGQKLRYLLSKWWAEWSQPHQKRLSRLGCGWLEGLLWFCQNGFYCPVLKHGPRSLTYMRVCGC